MKQPCVRCGRLLHTGEGRILVSFTVPELEELIRACGLMEALGDPGEVRKILPRLECAKELLS